MLPFLFAAVHFNNFVSNLRYMGYGMLGIMIVMAVLIAITLLLNRKK